MILLSNILRKLSPSKGSWWGLLLFAMASCTPDPVCRQEENVRCICIFQPAGAPFTEITVQGVGADSLICNKAANVAKLSLPLRVDANVTQYAITVGEKHDTLTIYHTPAPYFVSMACGCFVFHTIDSVNSNHTLFEEPEIINAAVQNVEQDNILLPVYIPLP